MSTRESVINMTPGQLREKIAFSKGASWWSLHAFEKIKNESNFLGLGMFPGKSGAGPVLGWSEEGHVVACPDWVSDLEAAYDLLDEMRADFFRIAIYQWNHILRAKVECKGILGGGKNTRPIIGEGITVCLAICCAYLLWKDEQTK